MKRYLLSFVLLFSSFTSAFAAIPQAEKEALYAISASVKNAYNWNEQTPVEQWLGVTVTNAGGEDHVTSLVMSVSKNGSNYTIDFSNRLADLLYLENFQLRYGFSTPDKIIFNFDFASLINLNNLKNINISQSGTINNSFSNPSAISQIPNLETLFLRMRSTVFKIPASISTLSKLREISYENRDDNSFTTEIFQTTSLEKITLITKTFSVSNSVVDLSSMTKLKSLSLEANFDSLPAAFYTIPNLETLSLSSPRYVLPAEISNYSATLKNFGLQKVPYVYQSALGSLLKLENLNLESSNIFLGSEVQNLVNLKSLLLESEYPIYLPAEIALLTNLDNLFYRSYNNPISEVIYTIPNIKLLQLYTGQNVSSSISNLKKLEHFQVLSNNEFNELPTEIGTMNTLKIVDFLVNNSNDAKMLELPQNYFSGWPQLQQFWTMHLVEGNITNRLLDNPLLETLSFDNIWGVPSNLEGTLNLCQNPKMISVNVTNNKINIIDLRNNLKLMDGTFRRFRFVDTIISKFIVDDVDQFNSLVNSGKIIIENNTVPYTVVSSSEPCQKPLETSNVASQKILLYPNPVKDILNFKTEKSVENVEVYSATGQKLNVDFNRNKADLSSLPAGVYMIKWSEGGVFKINKIIKE